MADEIINIELDEATVGPSVTTVNNPDDMAADFDARAIHDFDQTDTIDHLNHYLSQLEKRQYFNYYTPLVKMQQKLHITGITFDVPANLVIKDRTELFLPIKKFGGRTGMLGTDGEVTSDDGKTNGYVLKVTINNYSGKFGIRAELVQPEMESSPPESVPVAQTTEEVEVTFEEVKPVSCVQELFNKGFKY